jgi:hypothetical protein
MVGMQRNLSVMLTGLRTVRSDAVGSGTTNGARDGTAWRSDDPWRCTAQSVRSFASLTMTWGFMVGMQRCSMARCITAHVHVILTPSAQLRACSGRYRAGWHRGPWCAMPQRRSMTLHGAIGEIVHSVHYDSDFHGWNAAVFYGTLYHCTCPCHADQRAALRRMALGAMAHRVAAKIHGVARRNQRDSSLRSL